MALSKTQWLALLSLSASLLACSSDSEKSRTNDIFVEDQGDAVKGNARRHPADATERSYTIDLKGCSGSLISPELVITAAHCPIVQGFSYRSGTAISKNKGDDVTVQQIVEKDTDLDFQILKVQWKGGYPSSQFFAPTLAIKATDVGRSLNDGQGDEVFTVGFPQDKADTWGATYAEGRAKAFSDNDLYYNIGTINGNSGGGVWRKSDKMLVSLTNDGAHKFGESGWNTAMSTDQDAWNVGVAMWIAYANSKTLQDVFPNGKNRFTTVVSKDIFLALGEEDNAASDAYTMYVSAPENSGKVVICAVGSANACDESAPGFTVFKEFGQKAGRKLYKAARSTRLNESSVLTVLVDDAAGKRTQAETFSVTEKIGP